MGAGQGKKAGGLKAFLVGGALLSILGLLVFFTPLGFFVIIPATQRWYSWRNRTELDRHRERYQAIVSFLEKAPLSGERPSYYALGERRDAASLQRLSDEDLEAQGYELARASRMITARRMPDGRLLVTLQTYDYGHAGTYGLVFSSGPPGPFDLSNAFGIGGIATPVAPNWWAVEDYSH